MDGPVTTRMRWDGAERFAATLGDHALTIDGESATGASPMQHLLAALGGCMGIDLAHILGKMRTPPTALEVELHGERPGEPPRRFTRIAMLVRVEGEVPLANVERAVALSRDRYCSVWHSLDQETVFDVHIELSSPPAA